MKKTGRVYVSGNNGRKKRKKKLTVRTLSVILAALVILTVSFIFADMIFDRPGTSSETSFVLSENTSDFSSEGSSVDTSSQLSSDLSSSEPASSAPAADRQAGFEQVKADLQSFVNNFDGRIGICYINLATEESFSINEQLPFVAASSIKMGIVTQLFKRIASGELELTSMLKYDSRPYPEGDFEAGSGVVWQEPDGTEFSVGRTAQLAITISDNCATNMIIRKLGGIDAVAPLLYDISSTVPYREQISYKNYKGAIESGRHRTSAKDLAMYAADLYHLWKSDEAAYAPLMENLQNTIFTFGLQTLLPSEVKVAHKIGTNNAYRAENDVGIIFAGEPYVLCVMTETEIQSEGRTAVAEVSLMLYEYISSLHE